MEVDQAPLRATQLDTTGADSALRARWLGKVAYREAHDLQHTLFDLRVKGEGEDYLLLLEHPHTYTMGRRASESNLLLSREEYRELGAQVVETDRGGDVTYHGPGQLVGYPILKLGGAGVQPDVVDYVRNLEDVLIRSLTDFGIDGFREEGFTGVWTEAGKIAAIGCRITRGVTMHGFALNISTDMSYWDKIIPCGIQGRSVASMSQLLGEATPKMQAVCESIVAHAGGVFGRSPKLAAEAWPIRERRSIRVVNLAVSTTSGGPSSDIPGAAEKVLVNDGAQGKGCGGGSAGPKRNVISLRARAVAEGPSVKDQAMDRPKWLKRKANLADPGFIELKAMVRGLELNTVCEEAGCPNIYECWSQRTATLMLLGDTCTRSCGFCEVNTGKPGAVDLDEPRRVAEAVTRMDLAHAVLTSVARDDLADGGAKIFAESILAIRDRLPACKVEVLVPDFKGDLQSAEIVFAAQPDVFNHNLESVARLQRLVRPQASYVRSLTLLARAKRAGLVTKSGIICGMGETELELREAMADLRAVGVDILTLGQYLRPSGHHLPVDRWVTPEEFDRLREYGEALGFAHVESGPLVRSSYHARAATEAVDRLLQQKVSV